MCTNLPLTIAALKIRQLLSRNIYCPFEHKLNVILQAYFPILFASLLESKERVNLRMNNVLVLLGLTTVLSTC